MTPFVRPAVFAAVLVATGCSSSPASQAPDSGTSGTAGAGSGAAGTGGAGAPDAAAGTGGRPPDAGDGPTDAGPETPVTTPGVTFIQEDQPGFAAIDGKVLPRQGSTTVTGYTGTGFADGDPGLGKTISWTIKAETAGTYALLWRYAFGGAAANTRDAKLMINGIAAADVVFPYTTDWNSWQATPPLEVQLAAGSNFIQLQATGSSGLANIDYIEIRGEGITPDSPSFSLTVAANDPAAGSVSYAPVMAFYPVGTQVTVTATASTGYFFQSWTGDSPSATASYTFAITKNTTMIARFLPVGTEQDGALLGYAAVQDDKGTPYLLNGGSLGPTVTATTLDELKTYLASPAPYVVTFAGLIQGADSVKIASNKTLLGIGAGAHLQGIELEIANARNVIIRNIAVSHVIADGSGVANDAIVINGAMNVWVDHCELYSDLTHDKDYYDGLLEIKNGAAFITVSWCHVHDHYKASLISSGDEQVGDTVIRATYHHNYFHNCGSRMPSIRFGKAHIFSSYFVNNFGGTGVNSRMGAVVRVDGNYFQTMENPIGFWDSAMTGYWDVANNTFSACTGSQPTTSTGQLTPPYTYTLDPVADLPMTVPAGAGVGNL